jgi:hypothetical protein
MNNILNAVYDNDNKAFRTTGASSTPGTGPTNLGKAVDSVAGATDTGVAVLHVRRDTPTTLTPADGDYSRSGLDSLGSLWVREYYAPAYEDNTNSKAVVEHRYSFAAISSATTTPIKSGAGLVHSINIIGGTLGAITVYDNTAGSGTAICPTFTPTATLPCPAILLDELFSTGLTIVTAAATIINVSYR